MTKAERTTAPHLAVWVQDLTGSNGQAGLIFAALGLPAFVSPLLRQLADRVSKRCRSQSLTASSMAARSVVTDQFPTST